MSRTRVSLTTARPLTTLLLCFRSHGLFLTTAHPLTTPCRSGEELSVDGESMTLVLPRKGCTVKTLADTAGAPLGTRLKVMFAPPGRRDVEIVCAVIQEGAKSTTVVRPEVLGVVPDVA